MTTDAHWTAAIIHSGPARIVDPADADRLIRAGATLIAAVLRQEAIVDGEVSIYAPARDQITIGHTYPDDEPGLIHDLYQRAQAAAAGLNSGHASKCDVGVWGRLAMALRHAYTADELDQLTAQVENLHGSEAVALLECIHWAADLAEAAASHHATEHRSQP